MYLEITYFLSYFRNIIVPTSFYMPYVFLFQNLTLFDLNPLRLRVASLPYFICLPSLPLVNTWKGSHEGKTVIVVL